MAKRHNRYGTPKEVWLGTTSGLEFENVCADIFVGCGFDVKKMGGVADGGRDIIIRNGRNKWVVECKHQASPIGRPVVQKLYSAFQHEGAAGGIIISTSGFSSATNAYEQVGVYPGDENLIAGRMPPNMVIPVGMQTLHRLAKRAGIKLHTGESPEGRNIDTESVKKAFNKLKSHPHDISDIIRMDIAGHDTKTCWVVEVHVHQDFANSAGNTVYRMRKKAKYVCGPDGNIIKGKNAKIVTRGGDGRPKRADSKSVRRNVIEAVKSKYTKKVRYTGNNGVKYSMVCTPNARHIRLDIRTVGVRETTLSVKFFRSRYTWTVPDWDKKITCRACTKPSSLLNKLQLCNQCGWIIHARGCGGTCSKCKMTLCNRCSTIKKSFFRTRRFCFECA